MATKAECGTFTAYKRHKRNGEPVDKACAASARDQKNSRKDAERAEAAGRAQEVAATLPEHSPHMLVLEEIQRTLRAQMLEAPPQSVAAIARELRAVSAEIGALNGDVKPAASSESGGGSLDELAQMRSKRVS